MKIPVEGIATDAAHSTKNKITEFQGIDLRTGKRIFYQNLGNKTVNIGEFLGVVEAVKYIIENDYSPRIIYTDSKTAIAWFQNKKTASKKKCKELQKAEIFLKTLAWEIQEFPFSRNSSKSSISSYQIGSFSRPAVWFSFLSHCTRSLPSV